MARGDDEQSEEQLRVERLNLEATILACGRLLTAIRVTRWANTGGSLFWPSGVDKHRRLGHGRTVLLDDPSNQVGPCARCGQPIRYASREASPNHKSSNCFHVSLHFNRFI